MNNKRKKKWNEHQKDINFFQVFLSDKCIISWIFFSPELYKYSVRFYKSEA